MRKKRGGDGRQGRQGRRMFGSRVCVREVGCSSIMKHVGIRKRRTSDRRIVRCGWQGAKRTFVSTVFRTDAFGKSEKGGWSGAQCTVARKTNNGGKHDNGCSTAQSAGGADKTRQEDTGDAGPSASFQEDIIKQRESGPGWTRPGQLAMPPSCRRAKGRHWPSRFAPGGACLRPTRSHHRAAVGWTDLTAQA